MATRIPNSFETVIHFLVRNWGPILLLLALVFLFFAVQDIFEAYLETQNRPKEDMFWCFKHGPIRKKHCLILFPEMKTTKGEDFLSCPLCYKENVYDRIDAKAN